VAVLDTSVLVRAWLSPTTDANPSRRLMLLAGQAYDAFISPAILEELEEVLSELRFNVPGGTVRAWYDVFLRSSRQVFPEIMPAGDAAAVGGDLEDLPVINTAYAAAGDPELAGILSAARGDGGWFLVSENTRDFPPGRNVHGWQFITAHEFLRLLLRRDRGAAPPK
jgi:predicted nucleic acid-binding protein